MSFSQLEKNLFKTNDWNYIFQKVAREQHFGTKFYEMFFLFSPNSRSKFKNLQNQAKTFVRMLKLILYLTTKRENKKFMSNMKKAHKKHMVTNNEIESMKMALIAVIMLWLIDNSQLNDFQEVKNGINRRFSKFKGLYIQKKSLSQSTSSTYSGH